MPGLLHIGKAGQLAVMSELLLRGYNVAMPEVDIGDDILVVEDRRDRLWRVQVKTATAVRRDYGYSGQFLIPLPQLMSRSDVNLFYVLALRIDPFWEFLVLSRAQLRREHRAYQVGSRIGPNLRLYTAFQAVGVACSGRNFQPYRGNWEQWPILP